MTLNKLNVHFLDKTKPITRAIKGKILRKPPVAISKRSECKNVRNQSVQETLSNFVRLCREKRILSKSKMRIQKSNSLRTFPIIYLAFRIGQSYLFNIEH